MASPLPSGFDIAKVMNYLGSLPQENQAELLKRAMGTTNQAGQSNAQEEMVQRWKKLRAQFVRPGGYFAEQIMRGEFTSSTVEIGYSNDADTKPKFDMRSLRTLNPMIGKELDIGTTHRDRYLCGWVAVDDAFFGGASTSLILEDVTGHLVEIAVCGLFGSELPRSERQRIVESQFPKGKPIVVIEPYYKLRVDSTEGVRVDNAQELISWRDVPTDLTSWKKLGNQFFGLLNTQNGGSGAIACYQRAIDCVQPEVHTIAVLLTNIATCRFKVGDYVTSIQLSGVAVHLEPVYFKAWFRLASALAEYAKSQNEDKVGHLLVVARVVAHTRSVSPNLSPQQQQMLENILPTSDRFTSPDDLLQFRSYAEWCVVMDSLECMLAEDNSCAAVKAADEWRKEGSSRFAEGDLQAAESCYRKGVAASAACCRNVSLLLNNIGAVHLMVYRETRDVPGISVGGVGTSALAAEKVIPDTEAALLNCTIAGILDPLNYKAWSRRTRCLHYLGFKDEKCTTDLQTIRSSVLSKSQSLTQNSQRVQEFKKSMNANIELTESKVAYQVSDVPTAVQREERDVLRPENYAAAVGKPNSTEQNLFRGEDDMDIDTYIAELEKFDNVTQFAYAFKPKSIQQQDLPREMMMYLNKPPPNIHVEFPKLRGWPTGIDPVFARKVLYRAFLNARCNPWIKALSMRSEIFFEHMNPADLIKRWHGAGALQVIHNKTGSLKFGDIIDVREAMGEFLPAYDSRIRSNFANNPNRAEVYFFGTTHVAIGFNDFSSLLTASLRDELCTGEPLQFVGFEMSEFAVAKSKVAAQMLGSSDVSIASVMEVWLSSTWSETTLKYFRKSVRLVLESLRGRNENVKVVSYLQYWASTETISVAKARSEFFLNMERYNSKRFSAACSFHREIDRLDLVQYLLTGEIRTTTSITNLMENENHGLNNNDEAGKVNSTNRKKKKRTNKSPAVSSTSAARVGNITMWNVPPGAPPLEEDIALNIVDFTNLVEDFAEREKKQKGSAARLSVVDLFVIRILRNLERLRELMTTNRLTIQVHYGVVKAVRGDAVGDRENQKLLKRIAMMRPYTISWANVLDYFKLEDFHDLARRCSVYGDCMHYGYSMNWTTQVFGASLIDYDPKHSKQIIDEILDLALGSPSSLESSSTRSMTDLFKIAGLDKLLALPFRENPLNSTGYMLASANKENWVDYFMNAGKMTSKAGQRLGPLCTPSNRGLQKGTMELAMPSPLYRTSLTLYMSWCYDPHLRLQAANDPFALNAATDEVMLTKLMQEFSVEEKQRWNETKFSFNS